VNSTESLRVEMREGLAVLTMAQPQRGNPIDDAFTRDFKQVALDLWNNESLRAVLLLADGANFSFGGDLKAFYPVRDRLGPLVRKWTSDLHMGLQRFWQLPVPVVTAVQGFAMGGGVGVLAGCDVVLAGASARFGSAFAQLGYSCDSGSSATLTARMGMARARRFVLLAEMLDSTQALQAGLVDQVVADDELQAEALKLATKLAQGPTLAYGQTKRLFMRAGMAQLEAQLDDEALTLSKVAASQDAQEGIAAMVEKRKPVFQGR
jgi:2-(1,2-epoxy-1,2-dihydrophenyl)acetyl-CoA isomerase